MSMRTHTSLVTRDTNAPKIYQMTRFAGVNIKLGAVYVLTSLTHTQKTVRSKLLEKRRCDMGNLRPIQSSNQAKGTSGNLPN